MADELQSPDVTKNVLPEEVLEDKSKLNKLVSELSDDYSKYMKVDVTTEKSILEDEIEEILTRLDEFTSLVDMVRGDNALCLNQTLPEIHKKCSEIEKVFHQVDRLEDMVKAIKQNLDVMEDKVNEAEVHLDTSSVKKLFNSLQKPLFSKKAAEPKKQIKYEPPVIFRTEDFFPNSNTVEEATGTTEITGSS
ncbi:hypothetical protein JTE90_012701 [Oedothorax gibbosus]|uniref:Biogenesis of lysosome-related organelles complex 1 subunit 4 n=1 Tax=Oedothorax gibbosus TaxID=931172 RepID=A0AAV6W2D2_9ARAC|nr:hypothetical protein JTE90_012701 [Oedothorax gibbosus]